MTYIKCFLWQYSICHRIWTCLIKHCVSIFLTIQNMSILLLLTTRWPIMIHQSNLRLNNQKEMNFCLCVFDPAISLYMYLCLCITHTYQGCFMRFSFKHPNYFSNVRNSFKYLYWKFLRHISKLLFKTQCKRFGMRRSKERKEIYLTRLPFAIKSIP